MFELPKKIFTCNYFRRYVLRVDYEIRGEPRTVFGIKSLNWNCSWNHF